MIYTTPGGNRPCIYYDMTQQNHLLIAGKTGSGKSVVINGIIYSLLLTYNPEQCKFIFIDPKRVELVDYKYIPHCLYYASEPEEPVTALRYALNIIESRYQAMQAQRLKKFPGGHVYIVIDELADLMTTARIDIVPLLQRICQIGRAAKVHVIAATQCPLSKIIPTEIKVNFDAILGLKTATKQHSRNIINSPGCESLPPYGYGYYITPSKQGIYRLPMIEEKELSRIVKHCEQYKIA